MVVVLDRTILDPPVFLAPMAGITDPPFRAIARRFGAGLVVSEMIASKEALGAPPSAGALGLGDSNTAVQLAGCEPGAMAEAARLVEGLGARIIDINMGCPAKRVVNAWSGSALMRDPDAALRLVEATVAAVSVPVTLKMRLGWDDSSRNAPLIAAGAEAAGIRMITVHGRTRCQFYKGSADWAAIAAVKRAVRIPVIANGDITDSGAARRALALSGADGVMIGRGARGRPWLLGEIAAALGGAAAPPQSRCADMPGPSPSADTPRPSPGADTSRPSPGADTSRPSPGADTSRPCPGAAAPSPPRGADAPSPPEGVALRALVAEHYDAMLGFYGRVLGLRVARKHLGWYLDAAGADPGFRGRLLTAEDPSAVLRALGAPWPVSGRRQAA